MLLAGSVVTMVGVFAPAIITRRTLADEDKEMADSGNESKETGEEVTPPEDLMREHGVLDRVMLIYEAVMAKFGSTEDFDPT